MKAFQLTQNAFVQYLKNPDAHPFVGEVEQRRLNIYRDLFFNNILGFLSSGFPVLESLYSKNDWKLLARQFFAEHQCRSPYFIDISKEFVEYLSSEYRLKDSDPVFMRELAHYEWLELDVSVRKVSQQTQPWDGESHVAEVQMSKLASLVSYPYPVQQISKDFQPSVAQEPIYIVVYRDNQDEVNFTLVNELSAHLLNTIEQQNGMSVLTLTDIMATAMPQLDRQQLVDSLRQVLDQLLTQQILLPLYK